MLFEGFVVPFAGRGPTLLYIYRPRIGAARTFMDRPFSDKFPLMKTSPNVMAANFFTKGPVVYGRSVYGLSVPEPNPIYMYMFVTVS